MKKNLLLNKIIEHFDCAIYIKNSKKKFIFCNIKFLELFPENIRYEDILGSKMSDLYNYKEISSIAKLENDAFNGLKINRIPVNLPFANFKGKLSITLAPYNFKDDLVHEIIAFLYKEKLHYEYSFDK